MIHLLHSDVVALIKYSCEEKDEDGYQKPKLESKRLIYAYRKSVRRSEYYKAMQAGRNLDLSFRIRSAEYEGEQQLEYNGKKYDIVRTFETDPDWMELSCAEVI